MLFLPTFFRIQNVDGPYSPYCFECCKDLSTNQMVRKSCHQDVKDGSVCACFGSDGLQGTRTSIVTCRSRSASSDGTGRQY